MQYSKFEADLYNIVQHNNTPDNIYFNGEDYTDRTTDGVISYPFIYFKWNGINKIFYGDRYSDHSSCGDKIVKYIFTHFTTKEFAELVKSKYFDNDGNIIRLKNGVPNFEGVTPEDVYKNPNRYFKYGELFRSSDNNRMIGTYQMPEIGVCGRFFAFDDNCVVFGYWDITDIDEINFITNIVVNEMNLNGDNIYIANGKHAYIEFNKNQESHENIKIADNREEQAIHLMNYKDKHDKTFNFRQNRDRLIGKKLTMSNGKEMPLAQYNALTKMDESKIDITEGSNPTINHNNECYITNIRKKLATAMAIPDLTNEEAHYALEVNKIKPIKTNEYGTVYDRNQVLGLIKNIRGINYAAEMIRKQRENKYYSRMVPKPQKQTPTEPVDTSNWTGNYNYYSSPEMRQASDELLRQQGVFNEGKNNDKYVLYADTMKCGSSDFMADMEDSIKKEDIKKALKYIPEESILEDGEEVTLDEINKGNVALNKDGYIFVRQDWNEHDFFVYKKKTINESKKNIYLTEEQMNYIKESLLNEGSRDNQLLPYLQILNNRGIKVNLSQLKQFLLKKFVNEAYIRALSQSSNLYLVGVTKYYMNGDLTYNTELNVFNDDIEDKFNQEICQQLNEIIIYLRNAYIDTTGTEFMEPEDFGTLSIAKLFKKYSKKIEKLKTERELKNTIPNTSKQYKVDIMYTQYDCVQYDEATEPGAWCITYAPQHYDYYTRHNKSHFVIFAQEGYQDIPREVGENYPLDTFGLSLLAVQQSNVDGSFIGCTTRWNHGGFNHEPRIDHADNALNYEQFKEVVGISDEEFLTIFNDWKNNKKIGGKGNKSKIEKLDAIRKFKYAQMLIRNGVSIKKLIDDRILRNARVLHSNVAYKIPSETKIATSVYSIWVEMPDGNKYSTILDRGVVKVDEVLCYGGDDTICTLETASRKYEFNGIINAIDKIPETILVCRGSKNGCAILYDIARHHIINIDGFKEVFETIEIGNTDWVLLRDKGANQCVLYNFVKGEALDINGKKVFEGIDRLCHDGLLLRFVYDSAAQEYYFYSLVYNKIYPVLNNTQPTYGYMIVQNHPELCLMGKNFVYRFFNLETGEFEAINGIEEFDSVKPITDYYYYMAPKGEYVGYVYNTENWEPLRYPDGIMFGNKIACIGALDLSGRYLQSKEYGMISLQSKSRYNAIVLNTPDNGYVIYDINTHDFYKNVDGTIFFKNYYGGGLVWITNKESGHQHLEALPLTAHGKYPWEMNLNENKIVDFAAKDRYKITGERLGEYCHVIDEVLDEMKNNFGSTEMLTKESLDEICSDGEVQDVMGSFTPQQVLNEKFWDEDKHLNPRVRMKLLDVADTFYQTLETDWVKPVDIIFTGSLCNYNWSKYSDVDLHIVMNFDEVDERTEFVKDYFDSKKKLWNEQHEDLKIYGFPIELYVQDENEEHTASGIYSLYKDTWIKEPSQSTDIENIDKTKIASKLLKYSDVIDKLSDAAEVETDEYKIEKIGEKAKALFRKIKSIRKNALKNGNEFAPGNIFFKAMRRAGYIAKLVELKAKTFDKIHSIQ